MLGHAWKIGGSRGRGASELFQSWGDANEPVLAFTLTRICVSGANSTLRLWKGSLSLLLHVLVPFPDNNIIIITSTFSTTTDNSRNARARA